MKLGLPRGSGGTIGGPAEAVAVFDFRYGRAIRASCAANGVAVGDEGGTVGGVVGGDAVVADPGVRRIGALSQEFGVCFSRKASGTECA